ncbi:MAG: sigma-54-dependent Fis family transcriptional regulator [Phycisphaerae bacterium]|nr:sigma-54-dependent Fis family transcriptional regulator [Phycisphaerae bacterium]
MEPSPAALDHADVGVPLALLDGAGHIRAVNPLAVDLLAPDEPAARALLGRDLWSLLSGATDIAARWGDLASKPPHWQGVVRAAQIQRDDRRVFVDVLVQARPGGAAATLVDCTARQATEAEVARLRARLAESESARARLATLQEETVEAETGVVMIGDSAGLRRVRDQVARVAPTSTTVLIQGETGAGKELVARSIHHASPRRRKAFVAVNCAALPESLIESELFGHEKGAFTGADRRRIGKFELADGGTLFLDEIAELPTAAQAKLLRVLQDGAFERVGGAETITVDVRLIAATHRDLARQVERARFREDLFYRLSVFRIEVPPLRDRREDLRPLVEHLHDRAARRMARPVLPISESSMRRVLAYPWPGNVRELNNAVERATLLADGPELEIELPESPLTGPAQGPARSAAGQPTRDILLDLTLEQLQRLQITHALESCGYRVFGPGGAAERLDINPNTLLSRMDKFGIPRPRTVRRERPGPAGSDAPPAGPPAN